MTHFLLSQVSPPEDGWCCFHLWQVSPFARGGDSGDVKKEWLARRAQASRAIPTLGYAACYQRDARTLMEGGVRPRSQLHPSHIGEGLVRVDVSLLLSLRQRK